MPTAIPRRDPWPVFMALLLLPLGAWFLAKHALPRLEMTEAVYGEYYWSRRFWLLAHTAGGLLATLLGPLQFINPDGSPRAVVGWAQAQELWQAQMAGVAGGKRSAAKPRATAKPAPKKVRAAKAR